MVAPAILTNACAVLSLGISNRLARVVDRTRVVAVNVAEAEAGSTDQEAWLRQRERLETRAQLLLRALRAVYGALGAFAGAALLLVVAAVASAYQQQLIFRAASILGLGSGIFAVAELVTGCVVMVRETRLAVRNLAEEAKLRSRERRQAPPRY